MGRSTGNLMRYGGLANQEQFRRQMTGLSGLTSMLRELGAGPTMLTGDPRQRGGGSSLFPAGSAPGTAPWSRTSSPANEWMRMPTHG